MLLVEEVTDWGVKREGEIEEEEEEEVRELISRRSFVKKRSFNLFFILISTKKINDETHIKSDWFNPHIFTHNQDWKMSEIVVPVAKLIGKKYLFYFFFFPLFLLFNSHSNFNLFLFFSSKKKNQKTLKLTMRIMRKMRKMRRMRKITTTITRIILHNIHNNHNIIQIQMISL